MFLGFVFYKTLCDQKQVQILSICEQDVLSRKIIRLSILQGLKHYTNPSEQM